MLFETIEVGPLGVNCFVLGDETTREGVVVDPGEDAEDILAVVTRLGLKITYVINTHGHFDHVGANRRVVEETGGQLLIHPGDATLLTFASRSGQKYGLRVEDSPAPSGELADGMKVSFGSHTIEVLHTPGHTQGGCCLYLAAEKLLIAGDTLFADSIGRTDLPGGDHRQLIAAIKSKLMPLPDETVVWPGHGPSSTIGRERRMNPYINE